MNDPLGLIGDTGALAGRQIASVTRPDPRHEGPDFKEHLQQQIEAVNRLQTDAREAVEDLATGRRDDLEGVILATQKADTAFRMLLQVRNRVMEAYDEVKQVRV